MDWKTRLEHCRNAVEALENAEDEVGRQYRLEDRVGLLQAERDWNERRVEAMRRIRDTFSALEDAYALSFDMLEKKLLEMRPELPPNTVHVPRSMAWEWVAAVGMALGTMAFLTILFANLT